MKYPSAQWKLVVVLSASDNQPIAETDPGGGLKREYLYLNVLGFPPEPVHIKTWPPEVAQPMPVAV